MTQFVYGGAGGVVETRQCNPLIQLTRLAMQGGSTYNDLEFRYSASQNNGRITQQKDWVTGEEVSYTYDSLNRADHRGDDWAEWGLTFGYDGFGNKTSQTVTKGTGGGVITGDRCGDDPRGNLRRHSRKRPESDETGVPAPC